MATLALAAAGAAVGSALLPTGVSVLGATLSGAAIGAQVGALAGSFVDQSLFGASGQSRSFRGPQLSDLRVTSSTEGAPIPRVYGRVRAGGQVIWATPFEEEVVTTRQGGGGKGRSSGTGGGTATVTQYVYYANFAVALAEGQISGIGRVWADGKELNLSGLTYRLYTGSENQAPDSLILAKQGPDGAPAYRGIAYVVFEHLPLAAYGNRIPQLSFEVNRAVDSVHAEIRGVVLIPGSGEFAYATEPVTRLDAGGVRAYENQHTLQGGTDWGVSLDQLEAALPNARSTSLVVSWFGTDLRAGACQIKPGVELTSKETSPAAWSVAGLTREAAYLVSRRDGRPAYGGSPSDLSVIAAIRDLKARGFAVTLTPFILMDVPAGNTLTDPYSGSAGQPPYPWRGRITLDPAPGRPGSPDKTAAASAQIANFVGTAAPTDFALGDDAVVYSGPDEWTLRRQVLHYAWLARLAGGVDAFVIGSELRGLTQARSSPSTFPFVTALQALAADVKSVLGAGTKITYAADWSEYFGYQPQDGSGDVYFHLDDLWSSTSIDAVGIDLYWPLADWRDGGSHLDAVSGARSIYDLDYLRSNIAGGEGYDWYYAGDAARTAQMRTPITDGSGKPWVFRPKDLKSWWTNQHFHRPGGVEQSTPTPWIAQGKPFWFMEIGCPAVDAGANQPNVFIDPKSSESALPYFSTGGRDDLMQRRYLQALIEAFDPASPGSIPGLNPVSSVYGGTMLDIGRVHVYAWDARPYPAFPNNTDAWGDGANWQLGHWLNGRIAAAPLDELVAALLGDYGFSAYDSTTLEGVVPGYIIDRLMPPREALQQLELSFFFDSLESAGQIVFRHRGAAGPVATLTEGDLVEADKSASPLTLTRSQETSLPASAKVAYSNANYEYRQAIAESRRVTAGHGNVAQATLAVVLDPDRANAMADTWLFETWAARETAVAALPPSRLAIEPADLIALHVGGRQRLFRITDVTERGARDIEALSIDPTIYQTTISPSRIPPPPPAPTAGQPIIEFLDLPLLRGDEPPTAGYVAATQTPWPGSVAVYSSPETTGFTLRTVVTAPATMGRTLSDLTAGPTSRLDEGTRLTVALDTGELASTTELQVLAGSNVAAVRAADSGWEVMQFETARLIAPSTYELTGLLRGQAGTEIELGATIPAGARFILLDATVARIDLTSAEIELPLIWRYGPANRDLGSESYAQQTFAFTGIGRRPLSPAHVKATRTAGDLTITWIRRTRTGGDSWGIAEVPLGEDTERYEVDIVASGTLKRTITSTSPMAAYAAADQIVDFGSVQPSVLVRIYQMSTTWGRGAPAEAIL